MLFNWTTVFVPAYMNGKGIDLMTKWNETIRLFRKDMPLRRHWIHFRCYNNSFTASEAVDWLHELLKGSHNFGPEVTRHQTVQLLKKFLKNHVIEDIKGRHGKEDFEDNGQVYRFPSISPFKKLPRHPAQDVFTPKAQHCGVEKQLMSQRMLPFKPLVLNSESWKKRHSIAFGELRECQVMKRREITSREMERIWMSTTLTRLQTLLGLKSLNGVLDTALLSPNYIVYNVYNINKLGIVVLKDKSEDLPQWVLSAMKCLANWPDDGHTKQSMYPGFERDILRTVADYFQELDEPLLTFQFYDVFVSILGLIEKQQATSEALQLCCLLLPPAKRRHLQLLLCLMVRVCKNPQLPALNSAVGTRMLMLQTFSRSILCSADEIDLDELLATKLVTFMMDNYEDVFRVPSRLQKAVEEHIAHLRRVQINYSGVEASPLLPSSCMYIYEKELREQKPHGSQDPCLERLDGIIADKELTAKQKKKKLKHFQRSYPETFKRRFPTAESEAEATAPLLRRPQLRIVTLKKPFQRSWSFRA
nr:DEP domain-containing protein 1B isoform X1 [Paramormyrops kingsleyae]